MKKYDYQTVPIPTAKRLFDLIISLFIGILSMPIWIMIILAIKFEHILRGTFFAPLLYQETRISGGQKFMLKKFNIFSPRAIDEMRRKGQFIHTKKLEKRGEVTFVGKILKQVYLDELPQLLNVISGDLSLVGPRPVNLEVYKDHLAKGSTAKSAIRAGITGSFQSFKGETDKTDVELDQEYIKYNRDNSALKIVLNDIKILVRTVKVLIKAKGI